MRPSSFTTPMEHVSLSRGWKVAVYCKSDSPGIREKDDPPSSLFPLFFLLIPLSVCRGETTGGKANGGGSGEEENIKSIKWLWASFPELDWAPALPQPALDGFADVHPRNSAKFTSHGRDASWCCVSEVQ